MSEICEKCGSTLPEGAASCPNCGWEPGSDDTLKNVLSELGITAEPEQEPELEPEAPEKPPKKKSKQQKKPAKKAKKVRRDEDEDDYEDDEDDYEPRKPMKKRNAAIIGVLIGLFVALLLIAGIGGFMLYRLGVFSSTTDDDLLGVAQTTPAVSVAPTPIPVILAGEDSAQETPASMVEPEEPAAEPEEDVAVDVFTLKSEPAITLYTRGDTAQVEYEIQPQSAESKIQWTSDNELVASVDANGQIQARRGGDCTITGKVGKLTVEVQVNCDFEVPQTVLDMNYEDITMNYEGQTVGLAIDYELSQEYVDATVWESSDPKVAKVDSTGLVTAVGNGTAVITASIADYTASCIVRCVDVEGTKGYNSSTSEYVVNYEDVTLSRKGEYFQLKLDSVLPNGTAPECTWVSDDSSVATVDNKGVVTAVGNGTAYITTQVGEEQFRCIVRVSIG